MHIQFSYDMKKHFIYALAMGAFIAISSTTLHAQGLFAKAGQQAEKAVAVFESTWDDFYGKLDELLIAEVDKENGDLAFDSERGIASFTVFLKVNEDAYAKWEQNSWTLLEACGIKEDASSSWQFGRKRFAINDNTAAEINRVAAAGELTPPITGGGVVVKLVDKNGTMLRYAAFPFGLFRNGKEHSGWEIPAFLMHEMNGVYFYDNSRDGFNRKDGGSMKPASLFVTFAGVTRKSLLSVEDIRCEVLVAPKFQEECLRLSKEKIESDSKTFEEHGIESKVIMLSGKVPLAVNKTPRGTWFSRYEVTEAQWGAVMGEDNPSIINPSRIGQLDGRDKQAPETAHDVAKFFGTASFMCIASPDMPVDYISWFKAKEFIGKLNALPEVKESGLVFDIPNGFYFHGNYHHEPDSHWNKGDPHWEYACLGAKAFGALEMERQGVDFGLDLDGNKMELQEVGWCRELHDLIEDQKRGVWRSDMAHPVGMKRPNAFGLYDMIGNVSELVSTSSSSKEWVAKCPFGLNHSDGYRDNESGYIESEGRLFAGFVSSPVQRRVGEPLHARQHLPMRRSQTPWEILRNSCRH